MNKPYIHISKGFIATTAVVFLACSTLMYINTVFQSALMYADSISRTEYRIQAHFNAESCLGTVALMVEKDYFLEGDVTIDFLACSAHITRDHVMHTASIQTHALFHSITSDSFESSFVLTD